MKTFSLDEMKKIEFALRVLPRCKDVLERSVVMIPDEKALEWAAYLKGIVDAIEETAVEENQAPCLVDRLHLDWDAEHQWEWN
jgi:hypothetical protein